MSGNGVSKAMYRKCGTMPEHTERGQRFERGRFALGQST